MHIRVQNSKLKELECLVQGRNGRRDCAIMIPRAPISDEGGIIQ